MGTGKKGPYQYDPSDREQMDREIRSPVTRDVLRGLQEHLMADGLLNDYMDKDKAQARPAPEMYKVYADELEGALSFYKEEMEGLKEDYDNGEGTASERRDWKKKLDEAKHVLKAAPHTIKLFKDFS